MSVNNVIRDKRYRSLIIVESLNEKSNPPAMLGRIG